MHSQRYQKERPTGLQNRPVWLKECDDRFRIPFSFSSDLFQALEMAPNASFHDVRDLENYQFDGYHYYVFVGKSTLHVAGDKIEYVETVD